MYLNCIENVHPFGIHYFNISLIMCHINESGQVSVIVLINVLNAQ